MNLLLERFSSFQSWAIASAVAHVLAVAIAELILPTPQDPRFMLNWLEMASDRGVLSVYSWTDEEVARRFQGGFNANYPPLYFWVYYPLYCAIHSTGFLANLAVARDQPVLPSAYCSRSVALLPCGFKTAASDP